MSRKKRETAEQPKGDGPSFSDLADAEAAEELLEPPLFSEREAPATAAEAGRVYGDLLDAAQEKADEVSQRWDVAPVVAVDPVPVVVPDPDALSEPPGWPSQGDAAIGAAVALIAELRKKCEGGGDAKHADVCELERAVRALAPL